MATLAITDYVVIAIMLLISSGIGIYYRMTGGKQKTIEEFFTANKSMNVPIVAVGLMVSFLSSITVLGVSSEIYVYGTQYAAVYVGYAIATPIIGFLYLPIFFKLQGTTAFEYLQQRFGSVARIAASFAFVMQLLLYTGVVLYAPALAVEATTGLSTTTSIIVIGLICTFYSAAGGIKAVLATDLFQSILMLAAILTIVVTAAIEVGGLDQIWNIAQEGSRIEFSSISLDPTVRHTWWCSVIGGMLIYVSLFGINQVQIQRMLTLKNLKSAQTALWWSYPLCAIMCLTICISGLALYSKYKDCDPLSAGRITSNDQLLPLFVMDTLSQYPGVPGLFIAGIFSAALSTVSATVNSLSVVVLQDYVKPLCKMRGIEISSSVSLLLSKIITVISGAICIVIAFSAQYLGGLFQAAQTIFAIVGGPLLGLFTLGMCTRYTTEKGGVTGLIIALVLSMWMGFGQPKPKAPTLPVSTAGCNETYRLDDATINFERAESTGDSSYFYLYRISYMWYSVIGFTTAVCFGLLSTAFFKLIFKEENENLNPDLYMSFGRSRKDKVLGETNESKKNSNCS